MNSTVSKVDQTIVQHFIEEGYYERHLNKTRALYKNRHDVLIEALKPLGDICEISGEHAGVHILLTFKNGQKERNLIEKAKKADIRVYGLSDYRIRKDEKEKATILLGYANMREEDIKEALSIENCVKNRESYGGTGPKSVERQQTHAEKAIASMKENMDSWKQELAFLG